MKQGATEALILAHATEMLLHSGVRRLTVVGVAQAAGMSHANVYRFFPSRLALIDAVVGVWFRSVETRLSSIADSPDPSDDKLERMLLAWAMMQRESCVHDRRMFEAVLEVIGSGRAVVRRHRTRLKSLFERVLDEGASAQSFRLRNREQALTLVFDLTYRFTHPAAVRLDVDVPQDSLNRRLSMCLKVLLRMLASGSV